MPETNVLTWDKTGERFYENGVSKGVLYPCTGANGAYNTGVAWNGLTGVTESPSGAEPTDIWADNIKYATLRSAESFGGTIEAYTYPEEFEVCNGHAELIAGAYAAQQERVPFGFCYRTEVGNDTNAGADDGYKLHLVYGATVNPSEKAYVTINDSPDAMQLSWEFTTVPVVVNIPGKSLKPIAHLVVDSRKFKTEKEKAALKELEDHLYGRDADQINSITELTPQLPTPSEVITYLTPAP